MAVMTSATRRALVPPAVSTAVVGAVLTIVGGARAGSSQAIAALLATVLVIVFFAVGQVTLGRILDRSPELALSGALALYLTKILFLFLLLAIFRDTTVFDGRYFGVVVFATTLTWIGLEIVAFARARELVLDEPGTTDRSAAAARGDVERT